MGRANDVSCSALLYTLLGSLVEFGFCKSSFEIHVGSSLSRYFCTDFKFPVQHS